MWPRLECVCTEIFVRRVASLSKAFVKNNNIVISVDGRDWIHCLPMETSLEEVTACVTMDYQSFHLARKAQFVLCGSNVCIVRLSHSIFPIRRRDLAARNWLISRTQSRIPLTSIQFGA
jgi:hypothetical protein